MAGVHFISASVNPVVTFEDVDLNFLHDLNPEQAFDWITKGGQEKIIAGIFPIDPETESICINGGALSLPDSIPIDLKIQLLSYAASFYADNWLRHR